MNLRVLLALSVLFLGTAARAASPASDGVPQRVPHRQSSPPDALPYRVPYRAITPSLADRTIVLTGRDLTIDEVVQVALIGQGCMPARMSERGTASAVPTGCDPCGRSR